jgi:hypothetical protein
METGPIVEPVDCDDSEPGTDIPEVDDLNTRAAPLTLLVTPLMPVAALVTLLTITTITLAPGEEADDHQHRPPPDLCPTGFTCSSRRRLP